VRRRDVVVIIGSVLGLTGCSGDTYTWNQKLTVTVNTPSGERSGSAVTRLRVNYSTSSLTGIGISYNVKGEATVVEFAPGKYLFALLSDSGPGNTTELATQTWLADLPKTVGDSRPRFAYLEKLRAVKPVPKDHYPLLVTFTNLDDPKSVKEVKPGKLSDTFGAGYSLKSITVEITDEAVTDNNVRRLLNWVSGFEGRLKPLSIAKNDEELTVAEKLNRNAFYEE
jgi:hypothetical protein